MNLKDSHLPRIILLIVGIVSAIATMGLWVSALWTKGDTSSSLAGTGFMFFVLTVLSFGTSSYLKIGE